MTEETVPLPENRVRAPRSIEGGAVEENRERRLFAVMMVLSLLILMIGMIWTWRLGQEANRVHHNLGHNQDDLQALQEAVRKMKGR